MKKLLETPLGIHGAGMTGDDLAARLGFSGVDINQDGPITDEEADLIAKKIAQELPERIYAYSRGSAALNKAVLDDDAPESLPPVTYIAPAALRSQWGKPPVPKLPPGSTTIIGDRDASVPVKQACAIADQAGTDLYVHPGKSHVGILYTLAALHLVPKSWIRRSVWRIRRCQIGGMPLWKRTVLKSKSSKLELPH